MLRSARVTFKMFSIVYCISWFLISFIPSTDGLECLTCHDVEDKALCTITQSCNQSQSCYRSDRMVNNKLVITAGCIDDLKCGVNTANIIGRDVSIWTKTRRQATSGNCFECCSSDQCNRALCNHPKPSNCVDDELMDCSRMNSLFNICANIHHAKTVCPKFCRLCNLVDGGWTSWSEWTQCAVTCDQGTITRQRACSNPAPEHGGLNCSGAAMDTKTCFTTTACPIDGHWNEWNAWGTCSVSCEIGLQSRSRNCSNPKPQNNGNHCFGLNLDAKLCNNGPCTDGGWSSWSTWSSCSNPCGSGIKTQSRSCTNPKPSPHGKYCVGNSMRVDLCRDFTACPYADCFEFKTNIPEATDGIFNVTLWQSKRTIRVFCDMTTDGGGWTVFQNRYDGSVDFYRNFTEYENGFGNLETEFWLGLDKINEMANRTTSQLRIDVLGFDGRRGFDVLDNFSLTPGPNYALHIGKSLSSYNIANNGYDIRPNDGYSFSTYDNDHARGCASTYHGGWWYSHAHAHALHCTNANLNGKYGQGVTYPSVIVYYSFQGAKPLKTTRMAFRPSK